MVVGVVGSWCYCCCLLLIYGGGCVCVLGHGSGGVVCCWFMVGDVVELCLVLVDVWW